MSEFLKCDMCGKQIGKEEHSHIEMYDFDKEGFRLPEESDIQRDYCSVCTPVVKARIAKD